MYVLYLPTHEAPKVSPPSLILFNLSTPHTNFPVSIPHPPKSLSKISQQNLSAWTTKHPRYQPTYANKPRFSPPFLYLSTFTTSKKQIDTKCYTSIAAPRASIHHRPPPPFGLARLNSECAERVREFEATMSVPRERRQRVCDR